MPTYKSPRQTSQLVLAGGCFWCLEAAYSMILGIIKVTSGYAGGEIANPMYKEVVTGKTGHTEAVLVDFDVEKITPEVILDIFFSIHDPTTPDRQGNDIGHQYRSAIYYTDNKQKDMAIKKIKELNKKKIYDAIIVTEVLPLEKFYPAEGYHQKYFEKNPSAAYCQLVINPKILKLRKRLHRFLK